VQSGAATDCYGNILLHVLASLPHGIEALGTMLELHTRLAAAPVLTSCHRHSVPLPVHSPGQGLKQLHHALDTSMQWALVVATCE
jgi:hypothetical protein